MKLLLRKDIPNLGLCGDIVEVSPGHARNYLLPHHLALKPTKANLKTIVTSREFLDKAKVELPEGLEPIWLEDIAKGIGFISHISSPVEISP